MRRKYEYVHVSHKTNIIKLVVAFCVLSWQFRQEKHLLWKSPLELLKQFMAGVSVIAFDRWKIVGHITLWHLHNGWYEAGSLWVDPECRDGGIGFNLLKNIRSHGSQYKILLTTTNPVAIHLVEKAGYSQQKFDYLDNQTHEATCVCGSEKTVSNCYSKCKIKNKSCKLYVG
jgi:ribosomal protein S18 acetylase RimI-like enzyme